MRTPPIRVLLALLVLAVVAAGCGGAVETGEPSAPASAPASSDATDASEGAFPVMIDAANGPVEVAARPERIISLSPTATEMLFAIGAGEQVVAVDDQSNHPPEAPTTELSGFTPNVEAIAGYEPDLVTVSNDIDGIVGALTDLDVPTLLLPAVTAVEGTYTQLEQLGAATGNLGGAAEVVAAVQDDIEQALTAAPPAEGTTYFHELDSTLYTATSSTFIGSVYGAFGLENIADEADAAGEAGGYPQVSPELVIEADPDLVFVAGDASAEDVAARPGWDQIAAVRQDAVVDLPPDVVSRWGPRVVEFYGAVADALTALEPVGSG